MLGRILATVVAIAMGTTVVTAYVTEGTQPLPVPQIGRCDDGQLNTPDRAPCTSAGRGYVVRAL